MTSNRGLEFVLDQTETDAKTLTAKALKIAFRPEFINRIDGILVFSRLQQEHLKETAKIQIEKVDELSKLRKLSISLT